MKRIKHNVSLEEIALLSTDYFIETTEEYDELAKQICEGRLWFIRFIELCKHYYQNNGSGGSLHIILEDGNLENAHINWCAGFACAINDNEGSDIANLMLLMSKTQRKTVYNSYELYAI
jgi:hypothetical protein